MKKKRIKKKLTAEQKAAQLKKRKDLAFRKKIRSSFTDAGFTYFSTLDKHFSIGTRTVELDYLFLYENIIVICEDNTKQKKDIDHIRNKNESFAEIKNNKTAFLNWLASTFPEKATTVKQYRSERYFLYYIISQTELEITEDEKNRYSNLLFWDPETLSYFNRMAQCMVFLIHQASIESFLERYLPKHLTLLTRNWRLLNYKYCCYRYIFQLDIKCLFCGQSKAFHNFIIRPMLVHRV